jgi:alkylhydroperoxidase family enzyme
MIHPTRRLPLRMARIELPDGEGTERERAWSLRPELGRAADELARVVYERGTLPLRTFEAVRMRIAQVNDCPTLLAYRAASGMSQALTEEFYAAVAEWRTTDLLDDAERVAVEYAERYALDPWGIDDDLFARLAQHWSAGDIVEMTFGIARHLGFGRLTKVLSLDLACPIPHP